MTVRGRVVAYDENTLWGEVAYDLTVLKFHACGFHYRNARAPRVGDVVDIVFNQNHALLSVRAVEETT